MVIENIGQVFFANLNGWNAFYALIPLIIIYLIRPKPTQMEIPSLMFFLTSHDNPRKQSFLRTFTRDWLFLLHLLIICLLAVAMLDPFMKYMYDITSSNTVFVIDASGSMNAGDKTRFDTAKEEALSLLSGKNTIIIAKNVPSKILEEGTEQDAREILQTLKPSQSPTALGEAIMNAGEIIAGKEGKVVVISDFVNTAGVDPMTAVAALKGKNIAVETINVAGNAKKSVGIINLDLDTDSSTAFVRNYNDQPQQVILKIGDLTKTMTIPPSGTESYSFKTPEKVTKISLETNNDDLPSDNTVYISAPEQQNVKVMLITNNQSVFLTTALSTIPGLSIKVAEPPLVPNEEHDIYIFDGFKPGNVLPGTYENVGDWVKKGKSAIIVSEQGIGNVNFKGLLPVTIKGTANKTTTNVEQINSITKDIDFGGMSQYYLALANPGAVTLVSDGRNNSLITYAQQGDGKTVWIGIMEKESDFKVTPDYPIFWYKLINFLINKENVKNLNFRTGETYVLDGIRTIKTPTGRMLKQNALMLDEAGIYEINKKIIVANMLNEKESDILGKGFDASGGKTGDLKPVQEERQKDLVIPVLIGILALMMLELLFTKIRGDL